MPIINGYSDLGVRGSELYDKFADINRIDQAIYESEKEMEEGGEAIDLDDAFEKLNKSRQKSVNRLQKNT